MFYFFGAEQWLSFPAIKAPRHVHIALCMRPATCAKSAARASLAMVARQLVNEHVEEAGLKVLHSWGSMHRVRLHWLYWLTV